MNTKLNTYYLYSLLSALVLFCLSCTSKSKTESQFYPPMPNSYEQWDEIRAFFKENSRLGDGAMYYAHFRYNLTDSDYHGYLDCILYRDSIPFCDSWVNKNWGKLKELYSKRYLEVDKDWNTFDFPVAAGDPYPY